MPTIQTYFLTIQITENMKKWSKMVSNGFPLTPVTKNHCCLGSARRIDQPPGAPHWETEIWWEFLCHPMTLKSQTLAAKCCPRRPKWLPKVTLQRESRIFKNTCFTIVKHDFLRLRHLPNLPKKQVQEFDQLFDTTNTKKWASWLQSASQWAPPGDPKFTEFQ